MKSSLEYPTTCLKQLNCLNAVRSWFHVDSGSPGGAGGYSLESACGGDSIYPSIGKSPSVLCADLLLPPTIPVIVHLYCFVSNIKMYGFSRMNLGGLILWFVLRTWGGGGGGGELSVSPTEVLATDTNHVLEAEDTKTYTACCLTKGAQNFAWEDKTA